MDVYDTKYGLDSTHGKIKEYHRSRRMFAIKDNNIFIAPQGVDYSHAKWFELNGWLTADNDTIMDVLTRGFADSTGLYFCKGYDFRLDYKSEAEIMLFLEELVEKLHVDTQLHLYGGFIKTPGLERWPAQKDYGAIAELLKHK